MQRAHELSDAASDASAAAADVGPSSTTVELSLQIKWTTGHGDDCKNKINRLKLNELENVDKLGRCTVLWCVQGRKSSHNTLLVAGSMCRNLFDRAFPEDSRPDYITNDQYCRWTPDESW